MRAEHTIDHAQYLDDLFYLADAEANDRAALLQQLVASEVDSDASTAGPRAELGVTNLIRRFQRWEEERDRKKHERRAAAASRQQEEEEKQCTFTPRITRRAQRMARRGADGGSPVSPSLSPPPTGRNGEKLLTLALRRQTPPSMWSSPQRPAAPSLEAFWADEERWLRQRERKRQLARAAADEARAAETDRMAQNQRSGGRWVNAESRRILQARQERFLAAQRPSGGKRHDGHSRSTCPTTPNRHVRPSGTQSPGNGLVSSCQRAAWEEPTFAPVLSPRTRALVRNRPPVWDRLNGTARGRGSAADNKDGEEENGDLSPAMRDWLRGKKLSAAAERALLDRLYRGRRHAADGGDLSEKGVRGSQRTHEERIRRDARRFAQQLREHKKAQERQRQREAQAHEAFYAAAPFSPRIEPYVRDRDGKDHRLCVPSHFAVDRAKERYGAGQPPLQVTQPETSPSRASPRQRSAASRSFVARQVLHEARRQERLVEKVAQQQSVRRAAERAACPFRPTLSPRSRAMAANLFRDMEATWADRLANETTFSGPSTHTSGNGVGGDSPFPAEDEEPQPRPSPSPTPHPVSAPKRPATVSPRSGGDDIPTGDMTRAVAHVGGRGKAPTLARRRANEVADLLRYSDIRDLRLASPPPRAAVGVAATAARKARSPHGNPRAWRPARQPAARDEPSALTRHTKAPQRRSPHESPVAHGGAVTGAAHCDPGVFSLHLLASRPPPPTGMATPSPPGASTSTSSSSGSSPSSPSSIAVARNGEGEWGTRRFPTGMPSAAPPSLSSPTADTSPSSPIAYGSSSSSRDVDMPSAALPADASLLEEPETLLALSRWWVDLVDAHLVNSGEAYLAREPPLSRSPELASSLLYAFPVHRSSLGRDAHHEGGKPAPCASEAPPDPSGAWLREAVLGACSPFELVLPLPYVAHALSLLLRADGSDNDCDDHVSHHDRKGWGPREAGRRIVVAEEEMSIRSPREQRPRHVRGGATTASSPAEPLTSHRLYLVESGRSVALQRCPLVAYNNEVTFREFLRLYEWVLPLL